MKAPGNTTHCRGPGRAGKFRGSARHFAPEGREHIQFDHFAKLAEAFISARNDQNSRRYFGPGRPLAPAPGPLFASSFIDHVAHLSLFLRSFSQFVADGNNGTGEVEWNSKSL